LIALSPKCYRYVLFGLCRTMPTRTVKSPCKNFFGLLQSIMPFLWGFHPQTPFPRSARTILSKPITHFIVQKRPPLTYCICRRRRSSASYPFPRSSVAQSKRLSKISLVNSMTTIPMQIENPSLSKQVRRRTLRKPRLYFEPQYKLLSKVLVAKGP
jgi:hypothetical protein